METERAFTCPNPQCGAEISADVEKCPICGSDLYVVMIGRATEEIKKDPKGANNYVARGYAYAAKGDNSRAIADLDYAIRLDPNTVAAYAIRGMKRLEMGDNQSAIADMNYAIKLDPNEPDHYYYRGMAYAALEDPKNALLDFGQVMRLNPKRTDVYIERAKLFDSQGKIGSAIADLEKALQMTTDPYERTQIEDILAKERKFHGQIMRKRAGNIFIAILGGLGRATITLIRAVIKG